MAGIYPLQLSATTKDELVYLLTPHLPYSLPVLGLLIQNEDCRSLQVWTTFPGCPPSLYSFLVVPTDHPDDSRLFCSADPIPTPPTPEQESHIVQFLQTFLHDQVAKHKRYNRVPGDLGLLSLDLHPTDNGLTVGSIHEKWDACIKPWIFRAGVPCTKYLHAPSPRPKEVELGPPGYSFAPIQESDIDIVISASHVARSRVYIRTRAPTSVCARYGETPVAWVLLHSDGSIGTLHVEPSHRRKGLAQILMREIAQQCGVEGNENLGGGALGWSFVDVIHGNENGDGFYSTLPGWKAAWVSGWYTMSIKRV